MFSGVESPMSEHARKGSALGVVAYLILSFGLAWGSWALLLPGTAAGGGLRALGIAALPGAFAPAFATFVVRKWITCEGFADAGLGLHLKQWRYYLIAWFLPLVVVAFIIFCAEVFGLGHPDFSMTRAIAQLAPHAKIPAVFGGKLGYVIPLQLVISALIAVPLLFGEEFGWRGYLQLRLFATRPTLAAIATGIIWGLWHLPIILRGYEFPGDPVVATAVFCVATVLVSIVFGWLRERSGSVWVTSLAHSATNVIGGSLIALWFPDQPHSLMLGYLGVVSWIPIGLLCVWIVASGANASRNQTA
jgi:uncharacterized protein